LEILGGLPVPVPPLSEQHEIVRRVRGLVVLAQRIEERLNTGTQRTEKLSQAILAKAFRGELVPTEAELACREERKYETASELLSRITRHSKAAISSDGRAYHPPEV
jgi:type I restriction enzyme S subunit